MSDENPETTTEKEESPNARRMREQLEALQEERDTLMGRVRLSAFKEAGLDPEQGGLNKAVYRTYEGEPDPEQIKAFATQEYDWKPPTPGPSDAQQRMSQAFAAGENPEPRTVQEEASKAEAEGDWVKAGALKDAQLLAVSQKKFGF